MHVPALIFEKNKGRLYMTDKEKNLLKAPSGQGGSPLI